VRQPTAAVEANKAAEADPMMNSRRETPFRLSCSGLSAAGVSFILVSSIFGNADRLSPKYSD
jgi:hypothetical protein